MEYIVNGTFELTPPGAFVLPWLVQPPGANGITVLIDNATNPPPSPFPSGTQYALLQADSETTNNLSQTVTDLIPNETYTLSFWATTTVSSVASGVVITSPTAAFPPIFNGFNLAPGAWQFFSFNVVIPDATATVSFTSTIQNVIYIDNVSLVLAIVCYSGKSIVYAKNSETNEISNVLAKDIIAGKHEVFDVEKQAFVPVIHNAITGPTKRYRLIKKDLLGESKPSEDFYVTSGHKIVVNGHEIKARDIPGATRSKTAPEKVYTICVQDRCPILVNGLDVIAWGKEELEAKSINWTENKIAN